MGDPDHEEWDKRRVSEERLDLVEVERLRIHGRCLIWKVGKDGLALGLGEELDGLGVYSMLATANLPWIGWLSHNWAGRSMCICRKGWLGCPPG